MRKDTDTPRTDAFAVALAKKMDGGYDDEWYDWTDYARQLERELRIAECPLHDCCSLKDDSKPCFYR